MLIIKSPRITGICAYLFSHAKTQRTHKFFSRMREKNISTYHEYLDMKIKRRDATDVRPSTHRQNPFTYYPDVR